MRLVISLAALLMLALIAALFAGRVWVPPSGWLGGDTAALIITELRLPRTVLGALVGAGLGMAGAAMQGFLRNPLADPGLFGVSACAALGAVASLFFGYAAQAFLLPGFALAGAAIGMALLALLAGRQGSLLMFTLAGVVISSIAGAMTSLLISLAPTPFASSEIVTWLMGALIDRSWQDFWLALPFTLAGMAALLLAGRSLDALTLGEDAARSLGVDMQRLQGLMIAGVGFTVGASVAVAGVIGFVGLVVPHLLRPFTSNRPAALLIPSALGGAVMVVLADSLVRVLPSAAEVRLGIAMSALGAPFFLALLWRLRREAA